MSDNGRGAAGEPDYRGACLQVHMRLQPLAPVLVLAALATVGCGQMAGSSGSGTQPGPSSTISGRVVTYQSGDRHLTAPLPHVKVRAFTRAFPLGPVIADPPR